MFLTISIIRETRTTRKSGAEKMTVVLAELVTAATMKVTVAHNAKSIQVLVLMEAL